MKKLLSILLLLLALSASAAAQRDTTRLRLTYPSIAPTATAAGLATLGSLATFNPVVNSAAVGLRDAVVEAQLSPRHFDNYLQYLPAATPLTLSLCGLEGRHSTLEMALLEGGSYLLGAGWLNALKYGIGILRPDGSAYNSFPSGHTFTAFTGAEILRREYGEEYPWIAVAGYAVAVTVAAMRIYNNRHWAGDVLAGAGLGILSVSLVYWTFDLTNR